ncbi:hypothetical protein ACLBVB_20610, partial [Pseudomonas aeruginosa]|uniref:hypothetical protein n=1 Tax=Pseudomonas aeruginosa TaxID=287 RepID=UPI003968BAFB
MSPSRALSPLSRALLLACLGGPVLVSAGSACAAEIRTDARQYYRLPAEPLEQPTSRRSTPWCATWASATA